MVAARPRAATPSYLVDTLPMAVPPIFEQAQHSTANHRKNLVALRKIQDACATITERTPKGMKLVGEKAFNTLFLDMLNRVLVVKKGVSVADRVVKFVAQYVSYVTEQDAGEESEEETHSTRFVGKLLKHLLSGTEAKDKNVRFRVTLMLVSMINGLGEIDDDIYVVLRRSLLDRARDKETAVRVQAVLGLAKLQSGEDEEDLEDGEESLSEVLLDMLQHDPAAEVRRAALYNLPRTPGTLSQILARTRDVDPILRRTVYHGSLSTASLPDARVLSIAQREEVVRNGLGDREGNVRKAAAGMLGGWLDQAEGDLLQFLSRFDVLTSEVAEEALLSVFVSRPEVLDVVELDDAYWANLTPEKAFLARVYGEHLRSIKDDTRFEENMPVVTSLAFRTQDEYNKLVGAAAEEEPGDVDERAFVVGELLKLAVHLDYADETGRRKMFQLTREMISQANLPESLIPKCLDVLTKISDGERDLIRVIVDVIIELREDDGEEDPISSQASTLGTPAPRKSATPRADLDDPEAKMKTALIDLRCLLICISLLERVNSPLQDNSVFHGLLPDLIIPAVRNKEEPALRDQGLVCLGLCCMIDSKMAANSFGLFIQQLNAADDELKVKVVQIIFDLLMVQDITDLVSKTMPVEKVIELVRHTLSQENPHVQAAACEGVAKLMLAGMIADESILQSLVLLYFSPESADNQALRQCLTYFLPVYCYSSPENQRHMLNIFTDTFELLAQLVEEMGYEQTMLPLSTMGLMMVDWLDPQKVVTRDGVTADMTVQLDLSIEILKNIMTETDRDIRKALVSFLSKLNLPEPEETEEWRIRCAALLVTSIRSKCPMTDAASKNALSKFDAALLKKYPAELESFNEDNWRSEEREEVRELYGFIDDVEERDADAGSEAGSTRRGKGRRASEALSDASDDTTVISASEEETPKKRGGGRERMQTLEEEEDEDEDVEGILDLDE